MEDFPTMIEQAKAGTQMIFSVIQAGDASELQSLFELGVDPQPARISGPRACDGGDHGPSIRCSQARDAGRSRGSRAGLDIQGMDGWTAAMHAAYNGDRSSLAFMIGEGSDMQRRDRQGRQAAGLARERGFLDCSGMAAACLERQELSSLSAGEPKTQARPKAI